MNPLLIRFLFGIGVGFLVALSVKKNRPTNRGTQAAPKPAPKPAPEPEPRAAPKPEPIAETIHQDNEAPDDEQSIPDQSSDIDAGDGAGDSDHQ